MSAVTRRRSSPLVLAACCCVGGATAAGPARGAPAVPIARLWIGSENAVHAAADRLGIPVPPNVTLATVERLFRFLHPGDLRLDAPAGIVFLAGDGVAAENQRAVFVLPVKPGIDPIDSFAGARKTDAADTVKLKTIPIRRTAGYVVVGGTTPITSQLDVDGEAVPMRPTADGGRTPLASMSVDAAAWRTADAEEFSDGIEAQMSKNGRPGGRLAAWFYGLIRDKLGRASLSIDQTRDGLTGTVLVEPFPSARGSFPRPGLPAGCVARLDLHVPADGMADWVSSMDAKPRSAAAAAMSAFGTDLIKTCFAGDAETYALGSADGKPVFYVVTQRRTPADLAADVATTRRDAARVGPRLADAQCTSYPLADGGTAYRFTIHDNGGVMGYFDVTERGGVRYATFSSSDAHLVDTLAKQQPEAGTSDELAAGWVEPAGVPDVLATFPDGGTFDRAMPAEKREQFAALFGNARVTLSSKPAGRGQAFVVDLPIQLLRAIKPAGELLGNAIPLSGPVGVERRP